MNAQEAVAGEGETPGKMKGRAEPPADILFPSLYSLLCLLYILVLLEHLS